MAFTRKFLKALGIEDDKIETIMEEHTAVTDALKKERDTYKTNAEQLPEVQKELDTLKQSTGEDKGWKKKYEDLVAENQTKETRTAKTAAYRKLLESAGVASQYVDLLVKANTDEIDKLELDGTEAKDAEKLVEGMKTSLAPYISTQQTKGSKVSNPPKNTGGKPTRDEIMAIKDDEERQQAIAENMDLFQ